MFSPRRDAETSINAVAHPVIPESHYFVIWFGCDGDLVRTAKYAAHQHGRSVSLPAFVGSKHQTSYFYAFPCFSMILLRIDEGAVRHSSGPSVFLGIIALEDHHFLGRLCV